jgi:TetR/AcrR family transcriptional regulator
MLPLPTDLSAAPSTSDGAEQAPLQPAPAQAAPARKRPPRGQRRVQILQTLAAMLEEPGTERITIATLAERVQVSEAALYRHFASKAQMFEGLIEFIESSVQLLWNQLIERDAEGRLPTAQAVSVLLQFGERNPGMTRVMVGDALVFEHERLQARMNLFFDRIESQLRQGLRMAADARGSMTPTVDAAVQASVLLCFCLGRLQRYSRSGFKRSPTEHLDAALHTLLG